jgi:hypothetical protein
VVSPPDFELADAGGIYALTPNPNATITTDLHGSDAGSAASSEIQVSVDSLSEILPSSRTARLDVDYRSATDTFSVSLDSGDWIAVPGSAISREHYEAYGRLYTSRYYFDVQVGSPVTSSLSARCRLSTYGRLKMEFEPGEVAGSWNSVTELQPVASATAGDTCVDILSQVARDIRAARINEFTQPFLVLFANSAVTLSRLPDLDRMSFGFGFTGIQEYLVREAEGGSRSPLISDGVALQDGTVLALANITDTRRAQHARLLSILRHFVNRR